MQADTSHINYQTLSENDSDLNCNDAQAEQQMRGKNSYSGQSGDTLGGIFEVVVQNMPIGIGSHIQWDKRLDMQLAGAMMSIQAIKGVELAMVLLMLNRQVVNFMMKCTIMKIKQFIVKLIMLVALKVA